MEEFSEEQQKAYELFKKRENIFITGAGGCGKTYFIRQIYRNTARKIQVCATTGCAALLLQCNATTIHAWSGIGHGDGNPDTYLHKIITKPFLRTRWLTTEILVIDELSMLSKKILDLLDWLGKNIRKSPKPFGGIQVIGSGDFFQLPPVGNKEDPDTSAFPFESDKWSTIFPNEIEFKVNYRQSDKSFLSILNQIRVGRLTRSKYDLLCRYVKRENQNPHIRPAKLFPVKYKVNQVNARELAKLDTEEITFDVEKVIPLNGLKKPKSVIDKELDAMLKYSNIEPRLTLKVGTQVMCTRNVSIEEGIVNGTIAVVENITMRKGEYIIILRLSSGRLYELSKVFTPCESLKTEDCGLKQFPLTLAWAVSIHKSQGITLECAEMDIGKSIFEYGQTYVALSRVKSLDGLYLTDFEPTRIRVNPKVKKYYEQFRG